MIVTKKSEKNLKCKKINKKLNKNKKTNFKKIVAIAKKAIKESGNTDFESAFNTAYQVAKKLSKESHVRPPRMLPIPIQEGGFLPFLVPIFAGISAIAALSGGAAQVVTAINKSKTERETLDELKRHNLKLEEKSMEGSGLYLRPYHEGSGACTKKNFEC